MADMVVIDVTGLSSASVHCEAHLHLSASADPLGIKEIA